MRTVSSVDRLASIRRRPRSRGSPSLMPASALAEGGTQGASSLAAVAVLMLTAEVIQVSKRTRAARAVQRGFLWRCHRSKIHKAIERRFTKSLLRDLRIFPEALWASGSTPLRCGPSISPRISWFPTAEGRGGSAGGLWGERYPFPASVRDKLSKVLLRSDLGHTGVAGRLKRPESSRRLMQ